MSLNEKLAQVWGKGLATATLATGATARESPFPSVATVATVATVAVADPHTKENGFTPTDSVILAQSYIACSPLSIEEKRSRLADLARAPELARFWLMVWQSAEGDLPNDFGKIIEE